MKFLYFDTASNAVLDVSPVDPLDFLDHLPAWLEGRTLHMVNRINVPEQHRGKGIGRRLLLECLADADREGAMLVLAINPYGRRGVDPDYDELEQWYQRNGFRQMSIAHGWYLRTPNVVACASN